MGGSALMEVRILGPLEVVTDGGVLSLGGPQQRRILAALVADPSSALSFDRLVEVLWPDGDDPPNARRSAISYVSRLRAALGQGVIETNDVGYRLVRSTIAVDADRFVQLTDLARTVPPTRAIDVFDEALSLWRGPTFGDLSGEWWARPLVNRFEELRLVALADRVDAMATEGWHGRSMAEVLALVDAHPLREPFVERAMRGLHSIGQSADAIRVYQRYRSDLADRTGLFPSVGLAELERALIAGLGPDAGPDPGGRSMRGYVLRDQIDTNALGPVYRAIQPGVEREVAVTVVRAELADDRAFIRRFEAEAQLVARLEHPHVVPLYDYWRQPGAAFFVFRLMRGGSLANPGRRQAVTSLRQIDAIVMQIGSALVASHGLGLCHRALRASSIVFDDADQAVLAGLGTAWDQEPHEEPGDLDVAFSLIDPDLAGQLQDQRAFARVISELMAGREVPGAVSAVVSRAMSCQPLERYDDIAAMLDAWRSAIAEGPGPAVVPSLTNPYKGLRPFREADRTDFYGRADLLQHLVREVERAAVTTVVGPSGCGKPLLMAGVLPRWRDAGALAVSVTPGVDPIASLAGALGTIAAAEAAPLLQIDRVRQRGGLTRALPAVTGGGEVLVVIDQFEELWTSTGNDERGAFVEELVHCVASGLMRVVAAVRADFYDRPLADPTLGPLVATHTFAMTPMTVAELHDAVTRPAAAVGVTVESALAARLVAEANDESGSLPLLQFVLAEVFERRDGGVMTVEAYEHLGGLAGSLSRQADDLVASLPFEQRDSARRMFCRLVSPGEGSEDTRRRVPRSELAGVPAGVVDSFVARRLLTADHDRQTREPTIELAHEVLLRSWPQLRRWLTQEREWIRALRGLTSAASLWNAGGRDEADLLRGARLAVVAELAGARAESLTVVEADFLACSTDRAEATRREAEQRLESQRRQNRRLRRAVAAVAALLAVSVVAGALAVVQRQRADRQQRLAQTERADALQQRTIAEAERATALEQRSIAEDQRRFAEDGANDARRATLASQLTTLSSRSLSTRAGERDLAALLAIEAWNQAPTTAARSALFGTFTFDPGFLGYLPINGAVALGGVGVPGTTEMLVVTYDEAAVVGGVRRVDVLSGEERGILPRLVEERISDLFVAVSPNGRYLVQQARTSESQLSVAAVYDLTSGTRKGALLQLPMSTGGIAVDDRGDTVVVSSLNDASAIVFDATSGKAVTTIAPLAPSGAAPVGSPGGVAVAFGPDDRLYLGSLSDRLRVFEPVTFSQVAEFAVPAGSTAGELRFTDDGSSVITRGLFIGAFGLQEGVISRIDLTSEEVAWQIGGSDYGYGECASFAVSQRADRLWCGDYFGLIRERLLSTGATTGRILENQKGWTTRLELVETDDVSVLAGVGINAGVMSRWAVDGAGPIQRVVARGHRLVGLLGDGVALVGRGSGRPFPFDLDYELWDTSRDVPIGGMPTFLFAAVAGPTLFGVLADGTVGSFDPRSKQLRVFDFPLDQLPAVVTGSDDGSLLLAGYDDGRVLGIDPAANTTVIDIRLPITNGRQSPANSMSVSADGSTLFVAGRSLFAFDIASGRELMRNENSKLGAVRISPSGVLVVAAIDGSLSLFDPLTLQRTGDLQGARGFIFQLRFAADGALLLAVGNDGAVSIQDIAARQRLGDPIQLDDQTRSGAVRIVDLARDGTVLGVPIGLDEGVVLWDLDVAHWVEAACQVAGRNLTRDEWATYLGDLGSYHATCPQFPDDPG